MQLNEINNSETTPLAHADKTRLVVSPQLDPKKRSKLGQFMTPAPIATFMAKMFDNLPETVSLLDAGAGVGSLTAAFVLEACTRATKPKAIHVTAYEVDPTLAGHLEQTMLACSNECRVANVNFSFRIIRDDYVLHSSEPLLTEDSVERYDCAILNPPYAKINSTSKTRQALRSLGIETSNLYTAFVAVALGQMKAGGQLVAITPRSFCNGVYFDPFRRLLLEDSALIKVHLYESRKKAFQDDDVLQENIIYHLIKSAPQPASVAISTSHGPVDEDAAVRIVPFGEVVLPNDPHRFIRLVASDEDGHLAQRVRTLPCALKDLGITVSTGRVVDFRAKEFLRMDPAPDTVPLVYSVHFEQGYVSWPRQGSRKPNALVSNEETTSLLVPRGIYVLTKRFTSKEERRRIVAVIYDPARLPDGPVGFENHLNYFHLHGQGLPVEMAKGLALFLNSTAVDQYFRQFSGHTQVNATDLRNLHYPSIEQLEETGRHFGNTLPPQEEIDRLVEAML